MRHFAVIMFALLMSGLAQPALADQPEAREVARINNCTPKKIDVFQQSLGADGKTIYRVECNLPKTVGTTDEAAKNQPGALLIGCDGSMCELLRPVAVDKK